MTNILLWVCVYDLDTVYAYLGRTNSTVVMLPDGRRALAEELLVGAGLSGAAVGKARGYLHVRRCAADRPTWNHCRNERRQWQRVADRNGNASYPAVAFPVNEGV